LGQESSRAGFYALMGLVRDEISLPEFEETLEASKQFGLEMMRETEAGNSKMDDGRIGNLH